MADNMTGKIPTLEDVVEIGTAAEDESIRIVADNDSIEDAYDDEFNKLFEPAAEQPSIDLQNVDLDDSEDDIRDASAMQTVEDDNPVAATSTVDDEQLDNISISAINEPVELHTTATNEDDMWIQDWQEEIAESAVVDAIDDDVELAHVDTSSHDEATHQLNPEPALTLATESPAVDTEHRADPVEPDAIVSGTEASVSDAASAMALAINDGDDIAELVNDIVTEIMPEIEWKLRTRIRDILEQRFVDDD